MFSVSFTTLVTFAAIFYQDLAAQHVPCDCESTLSATLMI